MSKSEITVLKKVRRMLGDPNNDDRMNISCEHEDLINEETKLWRRSWVLCRLDAVIASAEKRATPEQKHLIQIVAKSHQP